MSERLRVNQVGLLDRPFSSIPSELSDGLWRTYQNRWKLDDGIDKEESYAYA